MVKNLLYIFQSENYDWRRFLKYAYSHLFWWRLEKRQRLDWTAKAIILYVLSLTIVISLVVVSAIYSPWYWTVLLVIVICLLLPLVIVFCSALIWPVDRYLKGIIIDRAKMILGKKNMIKIGITGSYGKTTMKEILTTVLGQKYEVVATPENINTDVGIARFIAEKLEDQDVLVVEMGAYNKADIVSLCDLIEPDFSILTGITSAHLERFGSLSNIVEAKFELPRRTKGMSWLNMSDENVRMNISKLNNTRCVGVNNDGVADVVFLDNFAGIEFSYEQNRFKTLLLAEHNIELIVMAIKVARKLGLDWPQIKRGVEEIVPIDHRLQPVYHADIDAWVLDDSYNANINGVKSGIGVLNRAHGRKIVLTPGPLVELGDESRAVHKEIGYLYADNVDLVLLIDSKETSYVIEGLKEKDFSNYRIFSSTKKAHEALPNILKSGDALLLQNDWPDVYF